MVFVRHIGVSALNPEPARRVNAALRALRAMCEMCVGLSVSAYRQLGGLLNVVHQAVELPLRRDLGASAQREAAHALVVPGVGEHRLDRGDAPAVQRLPPWRVNRPAHARARLVDVGWIGVELGHLPAALAGGVGLSLGSERTAHADLCVRMHRVPGRFRSALARWFKGRGPRQAIRQLPLDPRSTPMGSARTPVSRAR